AGSRSKALAVAMEAVRYRSEPGVGATSAVGKGVHAVREQHERGPVEARLRAMGVMNPRTLWRADAVDQAARQVIGDATAELELRRQIRSAAPRGPEAEP